MSDGEKLGALQNLVGGKAKKPIERLTDPFKNHYWRALQILERTYGCPYKLVD